MDFIQQQPILFLILGIWSVIWKGIALWHAAKGKQKYWFVVLLILNTFGIVEMLYLFKFANKKLTFKEMKSWIVKKS